MIDKELAFKKFKFEEFRPYQKESIERIVDLFNEGKRLVMYGAPTGSGKSSVQMAIAEAVESAYVVVNNNSLEDQYLKDFDVANIRGRAHYKCQMIDANCDEGFCQSHRNFKCREECPYKSAKQRCMESSVCLTNIFYFILEGGRSFEKRELLVLDDAHFLPETLVGFSKAVISRRSSNVRIAEEALRLYGRVMKMAPEERSEVFVDEMKSVVSSELEELEDRGELDDKELKEYKRLRGLDGRLENCRDAGGAIISREESWDQKYEWVVVEPMLAKRVSEKLIFDRADKVLISSATINPYFIADELDVIRVLGKGKSKYFSVPSTFPIERRPLYLMPIVDFKYKNQTWENQEKMADAIEMILEKHEGEKGIIFCQGYRYTEMLRGISPRLVFHVGEDRKEVLNRWMSDFGDKVLVGVKMSEGLDLKYDIARFAICFKAPFIDTRNARVAARLYYKHWNWYYMIAQQELAQSYGRIMRAEDDYGSFYCLDEAACKLLKRKGTPQHIKEAMVEVDEGNDKI